MEVEREDASKGLLILKGPRSMTRVKSGLVAAMGTAFALGAVAFLRQALPGPWKLIPITMAATGGGMAAMGVVGAVSDVKIEVERGKGITWTWRPRPAPERVVTLPAKDVATFEVKTNVTRSSGEFSFQERSEVAFHLMVVSKQGKAYAIEEFGLSTLAELRRDQIQRALGKSKAKAPAKKKKASA